MQYIHSASYLTLRELLEFDYDKVIEFEDYEQDTFRDVLSQWYFVHLSELKKLGEPDEVRIIFWFYD